MYLNDKSTVTPLSAMLRLIATYDVFESKDEMLQYINSKGLIATYDVFE